MTNTWMIRAGRGGIYCEDVETRYVAVGWNQLGELRILEAEQYAEELT